jgi:hypothetical protein
MNLGWQRARRILKEWAILLGLFVLLHLLLFFAWVALNPSRNTPLAIIVALMIAYLIALTVILFVFYRRLQHAAWPLEFREARAQGMSATAYVLEVAPTGWRATQGFSTSFRWRPTKREYQMRLLVSGANIDEYEVVVAEYLRAAQVPEVGTTIPIKIHPHRPEVVVLNLDATA